MATARVIRNGVLEGWEMVRPQLDELKTQLDVSAAWPDFSWEYDQATSCSFFGESLFTCLNFLFSQRGK